MYIVNNFMLGVLFSTKQIWLLIKFFEPLVGLNKVLFGFVYINNVIKVWTIIFNKALAEQYTTNKIK